MSGKVVAEIMLTPKQIRFAHAVAEDDGRSYGKCAIDVGYSQNSAHDCACNNLKNAEVLKAIDDRKAELAAAAGVTIGMVLREWLDVARADPNELVTVKVVRCEKCWEIPDRELPINPDCLRCGGEGMKFVSVRDTSTVTGPARRLYAGAKQTKDGIEIKMRDQDAAWAKIADYLGMLNKSKGELSGPGGGPIPLLHATPADLSDDQLLAIAGASGATLGVPVGVSSQLALPNTIDAMA